MSATAEFYLALAAECAGEASASRLDNVRDRSRRAETAWREMAARIVRAETMRATLDAEKTARLASPQ